jgi:hypothetical protein
MIFYRNMFYIMILILSTLAVVHVTTATDVHHSRYLPHHYEVSFPLISRGGGGRDGIATSLGKRLVVVGSANADCFLSVERLPVEGENLLCIDEPIVDVPGTCV